MKTLRRAVAALLLLAAIVVGVVYSGLYNVAADQPDSPLTRWLLHSTMERSVEVRAAAIGVPKNLNDPLRINAGAEHYAEMCVGCHLAPGVETSELREGLNPRPPKLAEVAAGMGSKELFWIIKHGVRMTAMPAWGLSHGDQNLWDLVAFIRHLPTMTPARYQELTARPGHSPEHPPGPATEAPPAHGHGRIP